MKRLEKISNTIEHPLDYLSLTALVDKRYRDLLREVDQFCQVELHTDKFLEHYRKAEFPYYLLPKLRKIDIGGYFVPAPFGKELPLLIQGLLVATIASHDVGISTFLFLQLPLSARTISLLGSEEQKKKYLPDLISLEKICGWALTERQVGSNSTRLGTTYTKRDKYYELSGDKRWIGNGVQDLVIIYGNLAEEKRVIGAVVEVNQPGVSSVKIPNKYGFRMVQNAQIDLKGVKVREEQLLPGADSYKRGVEDVIKHSRLIVIWNTVGACMGVYNLAFKHIKVLKKEGKVIPIKFFEKLGLIMGQVQTMLLSAWRLTQLSEKGGLQTPTVGMFKAWATSRGREICVMGREIFDELSSESEIMKMLLDMEIMYTYEGSYDMNTLLAGSQLTGIKAFT